jgi:ribosome-associated protein
VEDVPVGRGVVIPGHELVVRTSRSGGPGGQHVNTTDSRVELRWDVAGSTALDDAQRTRLRERLASRLTDDGVLVLHVDEHRSQHRNRDAARARLRDLVAAALTPPRPRRPTRRTRASVERRLEAKRRRGERKRLRGDDGAREA